MQNLTLIQVWMELLDSATIDLTGGGKYPLYSVRISVSGDLCPSSPAPPVGPL